MKKSFYLSLVLTAAVLGGVLYLKGSQTEVLGTQSTSIKDTVVRGLKSLNSGSSSSEKTKTVKDPSSASFDAQLKELDTLMNNAQKIDVESDPTSGL